MKKKSSEEELIFRGEISKRMKRLRLKNQLSRYDFANILGVHVNTIFHIENNLGYPSIRVLAKIQEVFKVGFNEICLGVEDGKVDSSEETEVETDSGQEAQEGEAREGINDPRACQSFIC